MSAKGYQTAKSAAGEKKVFPRRASTRTKTGKLILHNRLIILFILAKNNSEFIYYSKYKEIGGNGDSGSDNVSNPIGVNSNSAKSATEKRKKLSKKGSQIRA